MNYFYDGIEPILRIIVVGTLAYISLIILLRISGTRTLARMNAFDFVITITIGSAFGRLLTAREVSLAESVTVFLLLITLQYIISGLTVKFPAFANLITDNPSLLYFQGQFIRDSMKKQRVMRSQLLAVVREQGIQSLDDVEAIIMETAGTFAVIKREGSSQNSVLSNIPKVNKINSIPD